MKPKTTDKLIANRRDRKKREVIGRIKAAALEVFLERGLDDAKMTEIAERADVAARTLFNYITDKNDLLAFVMSDDMSAVANEVFPKEKWDLPIIDLVTEELGKCLDVLLRYFPISLYIFRESIMSNSSKEMKRILASREQIQVQLSKMIAYKQAKGVICSTCKAEDVSWILYSLFIPNVRRWMLTTRPALRTELRVLRRHVQIVVNGLSAAEEE